MKLFVTGSCYVAPVGNGDGFNYIWSDIVEVEKKIETSEDLRELEKDIEKVYSIQKLTITNFKEI